jgi:hypothetical protein
VLTQKQKPGALDELTQQKTWYDPVLDLSRPFNDLYPFDNRAEGMDQQPFGKLVKGVLEQRQK